MDYIDEEACENGNICFLEQKNLEECRASLGMGKNDCYDPNTYNGECHQEEHDLKKCAARSCGFLAQ